MYYYLGTTQDKKSQTNVKETLAQGSGLAVVIAGLFFASVFYKLGREGKQRRAS
jgi:hypothetical protein